MNLPFSFPEDYFGFKQFLDGFSNQKMEKPYVSNRKLQTKKG